MQEGYVNISGMPTKVITWGKWVEESFTKEEPKDIVLFIPGNPGVTKLYCEFLQTIHEQLGYPVWAVSQAGHELPKNRNIPSLEGNERLYGLNGQILYKEAFIAKYVPKNARIHFVGHSLSAYMILELLKIQSIRKRTVGSYLLFPTIENLENTTNGRLLKKIVPNILLLLKIYIWLFTMLPLILRTFLIYSYVTLFSISKALVDPIVDLIDLEALKKVYSLGLDELKMIKERDNNTLRKNKDIIKLYYGANDGWAPASYCEKLKKDIPDIDAEICSRNIEHAFVLKHSKEMGNLVADWIKK